MNKTQIIARDIRKDVLDMCFHAHVGHIGPALSIVDILTVLYFDTLKVNPSNPTNPNRDRFILSKGHAAAALFAVLSKKGYFSSKLLMTFCMPSGAFGDHPDYNPKFGIELTTGSLGHGLSVGSGMAMGLPASKIFVLLSDAELDEGSVWEAIMFAGHHHLSNLTIIIDDNGQQAFGKTCDVLDTRPLDKKLPTFGWQVSTVNGHDHKALHSALTKSHPRHPHCIIAKTVCGYGVSFMEHKIEWHYFPMNGQQHTQALKEIQSI
ncbi:transketolase [Candidatus Gottesmanbacteria bacterium]|nr:transketolase [Candidatus Gottesmanbacteria bacterium]